MLQEFFGFRTDIDEVEDQLERVESSKEYVDGNKNTIITQIMPSSPSAGRRGKASAVTPTLKNYDFGFADDDPDRVRRFVQTYHRLFNLLLTICTTLMVGLSA